MKQSISKRIIILLYVLIIAYMISNFALLFFGIASISTTISAYLLITFSLVKLLNLISASSINLKLFIISGMVSLFVSECALKYILKQNLSYTEKNGGTFYISPYNDNIQRILFPPQNAHLYVGTPNSQSRKEKKEFTYTRSYNSLGLRSPEPDSSSKLYNIVGLGDSFTEGVGVSDDSTWFRLFIDQMNSRNCSTHFQGLNGAISGSDLFYEYIKLKKLFMQYHPKVVILSINNTDIYDTHVRGGFERFQDDGTIKYKSAPWWEPIYACSFIARNIINGYIKNSNPLLGYMTPQEEQESISAICDCISKYYIPLAKENGFSLYVVFHPTKTELFNENKILNTCETQINEDSVHLIDLYKEWSLYLKNNNTSPNEIYWKYDSHHKVKGNIIWADMVYDKIEKQVPCN